MSDSIMAVYDETLYSFPPENLLPEDDPSYLDVEPYGGCVTCAGGTALPDADQRGYCGCAVCRRVARI